MDKINLHGVSIRVSAFKTAKDVRDANLFWHLPGSAEKENELIATLGLNATPAKSVAKKETPNIDVPQAEKPAE